MQNQWTTSLCTPSTYFRESQFEWNSIIFEGLGRSVPIFCFARRLPAQQWCGSMDLPPGNQSHACPYAHNAAAFYKVMESPITLYLLIIHLGKKCGSTAQPIVTTLFSPTSFIPQGLHRFRCEASIICALPLQSKRLQQNRQIYSVRFFNLFFSFHDFYDQIHLGNGSWWILP